LPGAALLNELIVYIWSCTERRGGSLDEAGKTAGYSGGAT